MMRPDIVRDRIDTVAARTRTAFLVLCAAVFLCTASGRIAFPDDEIVFQTTASLWERGSFEIPGIAKRTGEPEHRPDGTFGWAHGVDGRRYGFFGHGLSIIALPLYGAGKLFVRHAPATWVHAIRSDHLWMHPRSPTNDGLRMVVSLTNSLLTALAAWVVVRWVRTLGFSSRVALLTGLAYAFGTSAWPYAGTFLSEPLSALVLLASGWQVTRFHRLRLQHPGSPSARRALWWAALGVGFSVHVHILNVVAIPCFLGFALVPLARDHALRTERVAWIGALVLGCLGLGLVGWDHYARFGSPFETGRYGHYSHFIAPGSGLVAMLVSPGRSFFLYSPALIVAAFGYRRFARHLGPEAWFCLSMVMLRWLFVGTRSDWWGGWGIGSRYLVPVIGFALLPLASMLERAGSKGARHRWLIGFALFACMLVELHLSIHSIFEWMWQVASLDTPELTYTVRSHWFLDASPLWGFFGLKTDLLSMGAVRLARHGHPGFAWVFGALAVLGCWSAWRLASALRTPPPQEAPEAVRQG